MSGRPPSRPKRRVAVLLTAFAALASALTLVMATTAGPAQAATTPVMGRSVVSAADLAGWFRSTGKTSKATVSIDALAAYFIEEGNAEGVAGDIAFAQSIVETGYFSFSERVKPEFNNFSGLGAVDSGNSAEMFPDARTGVRAQIQHLRAYADPDVTATNLAHPLVDTRFHLVSPKGRAPLWEQFGGGVWATDPDYAGKIQRIRLSILQWGRRYGTARFAPFTEPAAFVRQGFRDILHREASSGEVLLWQTALDQGTVTPEQFVAELFRGEGAGTVQQVTRLYFSALGRLPDRPGLAYWTNRRKAGAPLATLASQVIGSREFEVRFGAPDHAGFIRLLYQNVLDRQPDGPGLAYWVNALAAGDHTRTSVLLFFSESSENRQRAAPRVEASVLHLGLLWQRPTSDDLDDWRTERADGEKLEDLAFSLLITTRYLGRF